MPRDPMPSAAARGYDAGWQSVRRYLLTSRPLCEFCLGAKPSRVRVATEVHHLVPLSLGGPRLDVFNLAPICRRCHGQLGAPGYSRRLRGLIARADAPDWEMLADEARRLAQEMLGGSGGPGRQDGPGRA